MAEKKYEQAKMDKLLAQLKDWKQEFFESGTFKALTKENQKSAETILDNFTTLMYQEELRLPKEWTGVTVEQTLMEVFPKKVKNFSILSDSVVSVLEAYFNFLQETKKISNGATLVRKLAKITYTAVASVEQTKEKIPKKTKKTKNKAQNGYTQAEIDTFNMFPMGNFGFKSKRIAEPVPAAKKQMSFDGVGRNDACPCGSGKKYKKCHGK